ncbi:MAG: hypothetical protein LCH41_11770 [Armatimonadetes bacterium]|jgi:hypothetical protein|nr:hypothetical protein [Armatimonadota bacterium]
MAIEPVVGDKYLYTWADLGKPRVNGVVELPGLGELILDDADIHYALKNPEVAAFFIRKAPVLGPKMYVVVSRMQPA